MGEPILEQRRECERTMSVTLEMVGGVAGLAFLYWGAEWLVGGGVRIAEALRVPSLVIGLTLVAFATSAPELVVSIDAALKGVGNVSMGNVVGSNICNVALILGASTALRALRVHRDIFRRDLPLLVVASLAVTGFYALNQGIARWEAAVLLGSLLAYLVWTVRMGRKGGNELPEGLPDAGAEGAGRKPKSLWWAAVLVVAGLFGLVGGAKLLVNAAIRLAAMCGVSDAVIGLTVVAVGTSLPELATSVVAAHKGENDIALGNVVGSNLFNLLAIFGIAPLISPIYAPEIRWEDMGLMVGLVFAIPLLAWGGRGWIRRWGGGLLLAIYIGYMVRLVLRT